LLTLLLPLVSGCKASPDQRHEMPGADAARGRLAIERVGCASCHTIPGIDWPQGRAGPSLSGFSGRALIAGSVPNRADRLAVFVRDAPRLVPGTNMPAMPLTEQESRDVALYLYEMER
jgi:cytochrome c1